MVGDGVPDAHAGPAFSLVVCVVSGKLRVVAQPQTKHPVRTHQIILHMWK